MKVCFLVSRKPGDCTVKEIECTKKSEWVEPECGETKGTCICICPICDWPTMTPPVITREAIAKSSALQQRRAPRSFGSLLQEIVDG